MWTAQLKAMSTQKKWLLGAGVAWFMMLLILGFLVWFFTSCDIGLFENENPNSVTQPPIDPAQLRLEHEGVQYALNPDVHGVLVMGLQQQELENPLVGPQADTIILLTMDEENNTVSLLSVPRDLVSTLFYPQVEGVEERYTEIGPLCNNYALGGNPEITGRPLDGGLFTTASLSHELLNTPIPRFVGVKMQVISDIADLLGGIEVPLTPVFAEQFQIPMAETVRIGGDSVEFYLRYRDQSLPDGGTAERAARQEAFLATMLDAVIVGCRESPKFIFWMFEIVFNNLTTDMSLREMVYVAYFVVMADEIEFNSLQGEMQSLGFNMDDEAMEDYIRELYYEPVTE